MSDEIACGSCGSPNPARAKFCLECGAQFRAAGQDAGERRVVSVVFADLSGFTSYSEKTDPEEVRALADQAAGALGGIVQRYGGTVDKIIGDCVMAVFGAPTSHEDDPERAVRAALEMRAFVDENSERFAGMPLRIGVNTGEAMFAPVGPQGQHTVIGDTVNTAARLQTAAAKGEVLVGEGTYRATTSSIELEEVPPLKAKGKDEPVPAWRAVRVRGAEPVRARAQTPIVGRDAELARLWELWELARAGGSPYLAAVLGPPGIGKSRLIDEHVARLQATGAIFRGRCLPYGEGITYWPVIEILRDAAGILTTDEPPAVSAKLGTLLEGLGTDDLDELRTMAAALANLLGVSTTPRGTYAVDEISQGELHWGVRRVLELLAGMRPVLLVLEDVHWAEPTLLELIVFILEADAPLLVVASARPELCRVDTPLLTPAANRRVIEVGPLDEGEGVALLAGLASELDEEARERVLRTAAGNPLFLEETVRMLSESGALEGGGAVTMPGSLRSLIGARLDRLPEAESKLAQRASVIGGVFWSGALARLHGEEVEPGLRSLTERDMVHPQEPSTVAGEREWAFKHALIRDVAYERLPKAARAELHARCGEWISALPGGEDEFPEIVAHHLEQACLLARGMKRSGITPPLIPAVRALTRAAERAEGREGTREADRFYSRAIELVEDRLPETSAELRLRRCGTQVALGSLRQAVGELEEVTVAAAAVGRPDLRCGSLLMLANVDQKQGRPREARGRLEEALSLAEGIGDARLRVRAAYEFASLRADFEGAGEDAVADLRDAQALADELDDRALRIEGHLRLGTLLFNIGRLADAEEEFARCALLASEEGSLRDETRATSSLGFVKFYRGDKEEAELLAVRAMEMLERTGDRYLQLQNLRWLAKFSLARDDAPAAEARLREALPLALESGGWLVVEIERYLVEALVRQGRVDEAREAVAAAREGLPAEDAYARAALSIAEGIVAAAEGDAARVAGAFEAAFPLLEEQGLTIDLAEARMVYAWALAELGDPAAARDQLAQARATFEALGALGKLEEIDQELAETGGGAVSRPST